MAHAHVSDEMAFILCPMCGVKMRANASNMCVNCLRGQVDITEGIIKNLTVMFCRGCGRYERPPYVYCELESRELLALLLKKVNMPKDVKLVDASFVWTEPHSRRIKVKMTIQKQVMNAAVLQQSFIVEFVVANKQCGDCAASYTEHTWTASVQVRQKVPHKRTMFYLEQLILKHGASEKAHNIVEQPDGLDFFFGTKGHAMTFLGFLQQVMPLRTKESKRLVSQDFTNNTQRYKYTMFVELAPVCKHDLVVLPPKLCSSLGGARPLNIVLKISQLVHLIDPITLVTHELNAERYFREPFEPALNTRQLVEFVVLDVERQSPGAANPNATGSSRRYALAEVQVMRASDMGVSDQIFTVTTHLGNVLHPGDHAMGYDLSTANLNPAVMRPMQQRGIEPPEVVLVKKFYPVSDARRVRKRKFVLKELSKEQARAPRKHEERKAEQEREEFLRDIEEDPEMWDKVNLYRREQEEDARSVVTDGGDDDELPQVPLDRLLSSVQLSAASAAAGASALAAAEADAAADIPEEDDDDAGDADME